MAETAKSALAKGAAEAETFCVGEQTADMHACAARDNSLGRADVADAAALQKFAQDVLSKGPVWGVVFNAGITGPVGPQAITEG